MKQKATLLLAALALSGSAFAQSTVSTSGQKYVLLEEATGAWCGYCVDGALRLEQITAANPKAIGVSIHEGDGMEIPAAATYLSNYITGYPQGTVDRAIPAGATAVGMSRNIWSSATTTRLAVAPKVDITMSHSYKSSTRVITINVTAKTLVALTGSYNTNVYVVEDSVSGTGSNYDQHNYYSSQSSSPAGGTTHPYYNQPSTIIGYQHMQVVRAMLGGSLGTTGIIQDNPAVNKTYTTTYTYTVPANYNLNRLKLVAMVQKQNATDKNDREIINARKAKFVPAALDVATAPVLDEMSVYPNPATSALHVAGEWQSNGAVQLSLSNMMGQTVYNKSLQATSGNACNETISTAGLSNGLYILRLSGEGTEVMQKVIIRN